MGRPALSPVLQAEKGRDNILPKIMACSDNYDALFQVRPSFVSRGQPSRQIGLPQKAS